jgi:hypothetical protein
MAENHMSRIIWVAAAGVVCLCVTVPSATVRADSGNPAVNCAESQAGGVDQDICVGKPGEVAGITPRDLYPGVVPRLEFGIGTGI